MSKPVIENENGEIVEAKGYETIVKSTVDETVAKLKSAMDENFDNRVREEIADQVEKSFEEMAKAIEDERPLNKLFDKVKHGDVSTGSPEYAAYRAERKKTFDRFLRVAAKAKAGSTQDLIEAADREGYQDVVDLYEKDVHSASDPANGGVLIPESMANEIIELRDNATIMRQIAGNSITIAGSHRIPREFSRITSYWADESEDFTVGKMDLDEDMIYPKKLTTAAVLSHELVADSVRDVNGMVTRRMMRDHGLKEDVTFLRGVGGSKQPTGLKGFIESGNTFERTGTGTVANIRTDLVEAVRILKAANHSTDGAAWILNSDIWAGLMDKLSSSQDTTPFATEMLAGRLLGLPFFETNQIPNNLDASGDGSNDESELYLVVRPYMVIADAEGMRLDASRDASYKLDGTLVSAFSRDQIVHRLITRSDFYYEYSDGAVLVEGIDW